jgi:hypothetical protein
MLSAVRESQAGLMMIGRCGWRLQARSVLMLRAHASVGTRSVGCRHPSTWWALCSKLWGAHHRGFASESSGARHAVPAQSEVPARV